jgi:glucose/arabinose dehydrogenase
MCRCAAASVALLVAFTACDTAVAPVAEARPVRSPDSTATVPAAAEPASPAPAPVVAQSAPATASAGGDARGDRRLGAVPAALKGQVVLRRVFRGLSRPVLVTAAPGDRERLFIVEKTGRIRIARQGRLARGAFLDIADRVSDASEQGLLGLAFHPRFATDRRFYVHYTDRAGDTRVVEYRVSAGEADRADPASARVILAVDQPYSNHNGGHLVFGPDGALWVGLGDGGSAGDPKRAGQDPKNLLGKMLRIDVDAAAGSPAARPSIAALGLRNPWRYDFDAATGDLYIADVGQNAWESIYAVPADRVTGHNFGWSVREGAHCFRSRRCASEGFTAPVVDYPHEDGCSVTGGVVYRGKALPALAGAYFYADFCTGLLRSFRWSKAAGVRDHWDWRPVLDPGKRLNSVSSFGTDADGEVYVVTLVGDVFRIEAR